MFAKQAVALERQLILGLEQEIHKEHLVVPKSKEVLKKQKQKTSQ
jgi:hypothetical protein